jgi:predicted RNA-binding Zn ribbon-like protein
MSEDERFGPRIGGSLCLDLVNTVGGWVPEARDPGDGPGGPHPGGLHPGEGHRGGLQGGELQRGGLEILRERLPAYPDLVAWGEWAGAIGGREAELLRQAADQNPARAAATHRRALRLREAIYRTFLALVDVRLGPPEALAVLNRELTLARRHERLIQTNDGFRLGWEGDGAALDRMIWPVAVSAADLLTGDELHRVGRCPGDECGWLFLDTSRGARRRWCDMRLCGNRAKVRRFRQRQGS